MHRRSLLLGAAAAVTAPLARRAIANSGKTLSIVPQVALNSIDPVWTSSQIARNMGFMVFDLLYGRDEAMNPRPQMLEGDLMEDAGRRWTLRRAKDCDSTTANPCGRATASHRCAAGWCATRAASPCPNGWMRWRRRTIAPSCCG
jgi:hypothetical protein